MYQHLESELKTIIGNVDSSHFFTCISVIALAIDARILDEVEVGQVITTSSTASFADTFSTQSALRSLTQSIPDH